MNNHNWNTKGGEPYEFYLFIRSCVRWALAAVAVVVVLYVLM